jgi:2-alkenal reductase
MKQSIPRLLVVFMLLAMLCGVLGAGVVGGVAGYYVAHNQTLVSATGAPAGPAARPAALSTVNVTENSAVTEVVKKAEPAVVTVVNTAQVQSRRFGGSNTSVAEGSGVIIDSAGHIVTNAHVVQGAQHLDVIYADGTKVSAQLVGADAVNDIAVLQVSGSVPAALSLGDSNALELGENVVAIGSPLGEYRGSVTTGVVSGLNRTVQGSSMEGLIQTDAAINHGNSGGPLLNLNGEVIGITTLVVRQSSGDIAEGLGFAVPSNTVSAVVNQLIGKGKAQYPFIGISYVQVTPSNAAALNVSAQNGVLVQQVSAASPAAASGLQVNDIITALDGTTLDENHPLRTLLFQHQAGDSVTLTVLRNEQTLSVKLTLTARPDASSALTPA